MTTPDLTDARRELRAATDALHHARLQAGELIRRAARRQRAAYAAVHALCGGSVRATARYLGISESTLRAALDQHRHDRP